jgi:hypothetical protein
MKRFLRSLIPDREFPMPILRGPFKGATIHLNPRHSVRKILGVYEHELNSWLEAVLPRINTVVDVGASEGYFTFGCAAAFRRLNKSGKIIAFEPEKIAFDRLQSGLKDQQSDQAPISLHNSFVGAQCGPDTTTLDDFFLRQSNEKRPENALIKIDVEGAELDVIAGSSLWLNPTNYFLIEVHWDASFLDKLNKTFGERGLKLRQIDQQALPLLGYEIRGRDQWWLVSEIS